jgi:thiamine biosynthesis lipoprotein
MHHVEHVMGMPVSFDVRDPDADPAALREAIGWLHDVDATFSPFRDDSVVCRLERGELRLADTPADVRFVLDRCDELRAATGGAFSVRARGTLDPSGFVKGWAVDRAAAILTGHGLRDLCVTAGGDVVARGGALPADRWRVGVQHPHERLAVAAVVEVRDGAVATSGLLARGAHVVDGRTGAAPTGLLSVTVTGPDLATADAWATALLAMGPDEGRRRAGRLDGLEVLLLLLEDGRTLRTAGFGAQVTA